MEELLSKDLSEEDKFYETSIRNTLCLVKCKKDVFGSRMDRVAEGHVDEDFDMRKPYDYLQLCYYKVSFMTTCIFVITRLTLRLPAALLLQG